MSKSRSDALKCVVAARCIPIEKYRLGTDGRKWKAVAARRRALFMELATYANSDGTFEREFESRKINYSPSEKHLVASMGISRATIYRRLDDLHEAGLLDWTREHHHDRRIYRIIFPAEQVSDSPIAGLILKSEIGKQVSDSQEQVSQLVAPSVLTAFKNPPSTAKDANKAEVVEFFIRKVEAATGKPLGIPLTEGQRNQLLELELQHGKKRLGRTIRKWCGTRDFYELGRIADAFFRDFDEYLEHVLTDEQLAAQVKQQQDRAQQQVAEQLAAIQQEKARVAGGQEMKI